VRIRAFKASIRAKAASTRNRGAGAKTLYIPRRPSGSSHRRRASAAFESQSAATPCGTEPCSRVGVMVGLDVLPRWARENVVRLLPPADALHALPQVSEGVLAALIELNLPIGEFRASSVEAVVQQAHAPRRAWEPFRRWRAARICTRSTSIRVNNSRTCRRWLGARHCIRSRSLAASD